MENKKNYSIFDAFKTLKDLDEDETVNLSVIKNRPINIKISLNENYKKSLKEGYVGQTVEEFLEDCVENSNIRTLVISDADKGEYNKAFEGDYSQLENEHPSLLNAHFMEFDTGDKVLVINAGLNCSSNSGYYDSVSDFIEDYNGDDIIICDVDKDYNQAFEGDRQDIPDDILGWNFESFEAPDYISINASNFEDEDNDNETNESLDEDVNSPAKDLDASNVNNDVSPNILCSFKVTFEDNTDLASIADDSNNIDDIAAQNNCESYMDGNLDLFVTGNKAQVEKVKQAIEQQHLAKDVSDIQEVKDNKMSESLNEDSNDDSSNSNMGKLKKWVDSNYPDLAPILDGGDLVAPVKEALDEEDKTLIAPPVVGLPYVKEQELLDLAASLIRSTTKSEWTANGEYKDAYSALEAAVEQAEAQDDIGNEILLKIQAIADLFSDLGGEELTHVGELQTGLATISPSSKENIEDGHVEAKEKLGVESGDEEESGGSGNEELKAEKESPVDENLNLKEVFNSSFPDWLVKAIDEHSINNDYEHSNILKELNNYNIDLNRAIFTETTPPNNIKELHDIISSKKAGGDRVPVFLLNDSPYETNDKAKGRLYIPDPYAKTSIYDTSPTIYYLKDGDRYEKWNNASKLPFKYLVPKIIHFGYFDLSDEDTSNASLKKKRMTSKWAMRGIERGRGQYLSKPVAGYEKDKNGKDIYDKPIYDPSKFTWITTKGQDKSGYKLDPDKYKNMLAKVHALDPEYLLDKAYSRLEAIRQKMVPYISNYLSSYDIASSLNSDSDGGVAAGMIEGFTNAADYYRRLLENIKKINEIDVSFEKKKELYENIFNLNYGNYYTNLIRCLDDLDDKVKNIEKNNASSESESGTVEDVEETNESLKEGQTINLSDAADVKKAKAKEEESEGKEIVGEVIDPDADNKDALKQDYIGDIVLQCPNCHSMIFKKPEDVKPDKKDDEESDDGFDDDSDKEIYYNTDEACPHCGATDGFIRVGELGPVSEADAEDDSKNKKDDSDSKVNLESGDEDKENNLNGLPRINKEDGTLDIPGTEEKDEDNEDFTNESLDELKLDPIITKYLSENYENIDIYNSTSVSASKNKLIVEGMIYYKDGDTDKSKFVFEKCKKLDNGNVAFVGMNESISSDKDSFTLIGKMSNNCFLAEGLDYSYEAKDNEVTKEIKGSIK